MANDNIHPIFKGLLDSISGAATTDTLPTSEGEKTIPEIMDHLMWASYKANRGYGCSHDGLVKIGVGTDAMRLRYDQETKTI